MKLKMDRIDTINGEFFVPELPKSARTGVFHFSKDGSMVLKVGGYLNGPKDRTISVPVIYGTNVNNGERISLVNCQCLPGWPDDVSYLVNEVYVGDWVDRVVDDSYHSIEVTLTGLSEWFRGGDSHWEKHWQIDSEMELILRYFMTEIRQKQGVSLKPEHMLVIKSNRLISRKKLYNAAVSVRNFLGVFLRNVPEFLSISFVNGDNTYTNLHVKHFLNEDNDVVGKKSLFYDLESYLPSALKQWFNAPKLLDQIVFLYMASKEITIAETAFTEITIALEVFHKHFLQPKDDDNNKVIKQSVLLQMQIEGILDGPIKNNQRWTQRMRYTHMWMELEKVPFFKDLWTSPFQYILKLNESRNYYTHYEREGSDASTDKTHLIWTSNQLFYKNIELRMWLKGLLLKHLNIHPSGIGIILNMQHMPYFYIDYESNQYSINSI